MKWPWLTPPSSPAPIIGTTAIQFTFPHDWPVFENDTYLMTFAKLIGEVESLRARVTALEVVNAAATKVP